MTSFHNIPLTKLPASTASKKDIKKELDDNVSCHQALGVYMHFYKQI